MIIHIHIHIIMCFIKEFIHFFKNSKNYDFEIVFHQFDIKLELSLFSLVYLIVQNNKGPENVNYFDIKWKYGHKVFKTQKVFNKFKSQLFSYIIPEIKYFL